MNDSSFAKFLKRLEQQERAGRNPDKSSDSSDGLQCNKINEGRRVSKSIWDVDIARTPHVVKGLLNGEGPGRFGIQERAWSANRMNHMIYYRVNKIMGGGIW